MACQPRKEWREHETTDETRQLRPADWIHMAELRTKASHMVLLWFSCFGWSIHITYTVGLSQSPWPDTKAAFVATAP